MYKKFLAGLLAFALVFGSAAALPATELKNGGVISVSAEGDTLTYGDFEYVSYGDSVAIRKYNGNDANVVIPSEINGKSVTSINGISEWYSPWGEYIYDGAFEDNKNLISITIPATVTSIGAETFSGCSNLRSVSFSENVTDIGCKAFYNCTQLADIENINNLKYIEGQAFEGTKWLEEQRELNPLVIINNTVIDGRTIKGTATIPEGITRIAPYAFRDTITVTEVEFPSTLEYIGERAFSNCYCINTIILPDSVENIGDYAFQYCTALKYLKMPDYRYADIGIFAFRGCSNIKEITWEGYNYKDDFGDSIEMLMDIDSLPKDCLIRCKYNGSAYKYAKENGYNYEFTNVFNNFACNKYEKCEWDNEKEENVVVDEGYEIYAYLGNEANVTVPAKINNKNVYEVSELNDTVKNVILSNGIVYIGGLEGSIVGDSIESINIPKSLCQTWMLHDLMPNLKKVTIDEGVTEITDGCLCYIDLTSIIIPNSVESIGDCAFAYCKNLTNITIPDSVKSIEDFAFAGCENLSNVTIGNGVTNLSLDFLADCFNLKNIIVADDNKNYLSQDGVLFNKNKTKLIKYPSGKSDTSYTVPNTVKDIVEFAFHDSYNLTNITIPKSVTNIEDRAFSMSRFLIKCYSNTAGEKYAKDNGFDYELLDKPAVNGTGKVNVANSTSGLKVENLSVSIGKSGSDKTDKTVKADADGKFTVEGLADGKYDFTFTADKCVPRTYSVSVSGGTFKLDSVELHLYGDVNGDGELTTADVGKANADTRNSKKLTDSYDKKVADVNGDGKITTADVGKVNAHVRGTKNLW